MRTKNLTRSVFFPLVVLLFLLRPFMSKSAAHVELFSDSCSAGTDYIEFRLFATNNSTAGETLYLSSGTLRFMHGTAIVPSGTQSYDFVYLNGTCDPSLTPLYTLLGSSYNMNYNPATRLMQVAYSTGTLGNSFATTNAPILAGQTICLGAFRLTVTSAPWVDNQPVGFSWSGTSSGITAFEDTASVVTNMNTAANRTLGAMCTMTTPSTTSVGVPTGTENTCIYPCPAYSYLHVKGIAVGTMIHVVSPAGKCELSLPFEGDQLDIPVSGLSKGVYLLEAGTLRRTFIVQ